MQHGYLETECIQRPASLAWLALEQGSAPTVMRTITSGVLNQFNACQADA